MFDRTIRRVSLRLAVGACWFVLACAGVAALAAPAHALILKSSIPGAHYEANAAARVELNRAASRTQNKNVAGAETAALAATRADSTSGEAWQTLGLIRLSRGNSQGARVALERAASLSPERPDVWTRLSQVCLLDLGLVEDGVTALDAAIAADSTYGPAWYSRAFFLWGLGDLDGANDALERARANALSPSQSALFYSAQLGVLTSRGQYAQAASAIKNYRYDLQDDVTALQHEEHALRGLGDNEGAIRSLDALRATFPKEPLWKIETGHAYRGLAKPDSARVWFTRAAATDTSSFDAGYNKALALAATRDTARAWAELRRLRALDPQNWLVPLLASRLHRAAGDTARAALAFEEARRLNPALGLAGAGAAGGAAIPAWSSPDLEAAEALIDAGDFTLAMDRLYAVTRDSVRTGAALFWISRVTRMSTKQTGPPVVTATYAAQASRGDPVVLRALAEAQLAAGDTARAVANLLAVRKAAPDDAIASTLLVAVLLHGGQPVRARSIYNEFALEPTRSWRVESVRADALAAVKDPGASIARTRAAAIDYLPPRGR
jgi:tetratricopeptide (TPR) repeat protein